MITKGAGIRLNEGRLLLYKAKCFEWGILVVSFADKNTHRKTNLQAPHVMTCNSIKIRVKQVFLTHQFKCIDPWLPGLADLFFCFTILYLLL
jgi:hypothetical protein